MLDPNAFVEQSGLSEETHLMTDPDPDVTHLQIHGWKLLLLPIRVSDKTKGGVLLPTQTTDDFSYLNNVCKVLKLGPLAYSHEMLANKPWCKEGDYVLIPRNCGIKIKSKGVSLQIVKDTDILMTLDDPELIDQQKYS